MQCTAEVSRRLGDARAQRSLFWSSLVCLSWTESLLSPSHANHLPERGVRMNETTPLLPASPACASTDADLGTLPVYQTIVSISGTGSFAMPREGTTIELTLLSPIALSAVRRLPRNLPGHRRPTLRRTTPLS